MTSMMAAISILMLTSQVRAWGEVALPTCKINGKREYANGGDCVAMVDHFADHGMKFSVEVRADDTDTLSRVLDVAEKYGDPNVIEPLRAAAKQGWKRFQDQVDLEMRSGRVTGWQVGHEVGSIVGKLAGGLSLGALGFGAGAGIGSLTGLAAGLVPFAASATLCPHCAVTELLASAAVISTSLGTVAGAYKGAQLGVSVGATVGEAVGGQVIGLVGQELGGTLGAGSAIAQGLIFQLPQGMTLAFDYVAQVDGTMKLLAYHVVI